MFGLYAIKGFLIAELHRRLMGRFLAIPISVLALALVWRVGFMNRIALRCRKPALASTGRHRLRATPFFAAEALPRH